jgi:hypothetical protein
MATRERPARALRVRVNGKDEGWQLPSFNGVPRILLDSTPSLRPAVPCHPSWKVEILDDAATQARVLGGN